MWLLVKLEDATTNIREWGKWSYKFEVMLELESNQIKYFGCSKFFHHISNVTCTS